MFLSNTVFTGRNTCVPASQEYVNIYSTCRLLTTILLQERRRALHFLRGHARLRRAIGERTATDARRGLRSLAAHRRAARSAISSRAHAAADLFGVLSKYAR